MEYITKEPTYPTKKLKIEKFIPLLEGIKESLEELDEYPSAGVLFEAYENGEIDKDFMYMIAYGRDLSQDIYKMARDNYES